MPYPAGARVLVTGGAGFIGCAISQQMAPACERYVAVDNLHPQVHAARSRPARLEPSAELFVEDVASAGAWDRILDGFSPGLLIHLAAETGTAQSLTEATRHANVNVLGTARMLDALSARGLQPEAIVLCSSRAVYGEGRWSRPDGSHVYPGRRPHHQLASGDWDFNGCTPLPSDSITTRAQPTSIYGSTKLAQENLLLAWCAAMEVPLVVLRLQNVYGPGQSLTNPYTGIVSLFARVARSGESIPVFEDGRVTRDFVFIEDVVAAIEAGAQRASRDPMIVDIGSGAPISLSELAAEVAHLYGAPHPHVTAQYRDGDVRHASCTIDRAAALLGWRPKWSLGEGLVALKQWIDSELEPSLDPDGTVGRR